MGVNNLSANNVADMQNSQTIQQQKDTKASNIQESENHNYSKYFKIAGITAAAIAVGAGIIHMAKKGKIPEIKDIAEYKIKVDPETKKIINPEQIGILYKKGSDELYTGKVKKTLEDGSGIILEYKDGLIQKSIKEGEKGWEKGFNYAKDNKTLETIISTATKDGKVETIDVKKTKKAADDFARLIGDEIKSIDEFEETLNKIEFGSNSQKEAIHRKASNIIKEKKQKFLNNLKNETKQNDASGRELNRVHSEKRSGNIKERIVNLFKSDKNALSKENYSKNVYNALKDVKEEKIEAMSDDFLITLLEGNSRRNRADIIEAINEFSVEEIRRITSLPKNQNYQKYLADYIRGNGKKDQLNKFKNILHKCVKK